jgi:hypothetical protein
MPSELKSLSSSPLAVLGFVAEVGFTLDGEVKCARSSFLG